MIPITQILQAIAAQPVQSGPRNALPRIENATTQRASIYLLDAVSQWTPANAKDFQKALADITAPNIDLFINSPGGSVFEGVAMHSLLVAHPSRITVHVIGIAASIASVIAMAGDEIRISEGAMMMIHSPSIGTGGNASQLRKDAALLDQIEESILDIYVGKTGRNRAEIKQLVQAETWLSADDAVKGKFATRKTAAVKIAAAWNPALHPALPPAALVAAGITPAPATRRETSAELDRLRAENLWLAAKLRTATAKQPAKPAPMNVLQTYQAMPAGPLKTAYLRANAVKIQTLSKLESNR